MSEAGKAHGGMAVPMAGSEAALSKAKEQSPTMSPHWHDARATSCPSNREQIGCELAAEVLRSSGKLRFRATGVSMLPTVWPGDVLLVHRPHALPVLPGDIVLFARAGRLVAHRVVEKRDTRNGTRETGYEIRETAEACPAPAVPRNVSEPFTNLQSSIENRQSTIDNCQSAIPNPEPPIPNPEFVTRGDSVGHDDPPISSRAVLGRVIAIERHGRRISPRLTFWGRAAASLLSRSELCTRALLGLRRRTQFPAQ